MSGNISPAIMRPSILAIVTGLAVSLTPSFAGPEGGSVAQGVATIDQSQPGVTAIRQVSDRALLNWNSFSTAPTEAVHFVQPSASSIAVNRVTGVTPSLLNGTLSANGRVMLLNPNGIMFGPTSRVDVHGIVASTLDMPDSELNKPVISLNQSGAHGQAAVVNQGTITAGRGGQVALIAPVVSNQGTITAPGGRVGLGAGTSAVLDLDGGGLVTMNVQNVPRGAVSLPVEAATDLLKQAVNNSDITPAGSVTISGGRITLGNATGIATNEGRIHVDAPAGGQAGHVVIQGTQAAIAAPRSLITASTAEPGGTGGRVQLLSPGTALFTRTSRIEARGGQGGKGGFVEVSGNKNVSVNGELDLSAAGGRSGTLFIDPENVFIVNDDGPGGTGGANDAEITGDGELLAGELSGSDAEISESSLESLSGVDIVIEANNSITVEDISLDGGANTDALEIAGGLTLRTHTGDIVFLNQTNQLIVHGDLTVAAGDSATGNAVLPGIAADGAVTLVAGLNEGNVNQQGAIDAGGDITLFALFGPGSITTGSLTSFNGSVLAVAGDGGGDITVQGDVNASGGVTLNVGVGAGSVTASNITAGGNVFLGAGDQGGTPGAGLAPGFAITQTGTILSGGTVTLDGGNSVLADADTSINAGNVFAGSILAAGNILVQSNLGGGNITVADLNSAGGGVTVRSGNLAGSDGFGDIQTGDITSGGGSTLVEVGFSGGNITAGDVSSIGNVRLNAGGVAVGGVDVGGIQAPGLAEVFTGDRGGTIAVHGDVDAGFVSVFGAGNELFEGSVAGQFGVNIQVSNSAFGQITAGDISSDAGFVFLFSGGLGGNVEQTGSITADQSITLFAGFADGDVNFGDLATPGGILVLAGDLDGNVTQSGTLIQAGDVTIRAGIFAAGNVNVASIDSTGAVFLQAGDTRGDVVQTGTITAQGSISLLGAASGDGNVTFGDLSTPDNVSLIAGLFNGNVTQVGTSVQAGSVSIQAGILEAGDVIIKTVQSAGDVSIQAGNASGNIFQSGTITSGGDISLTGGTGNSNIFIENLNAAGGVSVVAGLSGGDVGHTGSIIAAGDIELKAGLNDGNIVAGNLTSTQGGITIAAGQNAGNVFQTGLIDAALNVDVSAGLIAGGLVNLGDVVSNSGSVLLSSGAAGGDVSAININAATDVLILAGNDVGNVVASTITAGADVTIFAGLDVGSVTVGSINAGGTISIFAGLAGGDIIVQSIQSGSGSFLSAIGTVSVTGLNSVSVTAAGDAIGFGATLADSELFGDEKSESAKVVQAAKAKEIRKVSRGGSGEGQTPGGNVTRSDGPQRIDRVAVPSQN